MKVTSLTKTHVMILAGTGAVFLTLVILGLVGYAPKPPVITKEFTPFAESAPSSTP